MRRLFVVGSLAVSLLGLFAGSQAHAVSTFSARAVAGVSLSTDLDGGLGQLAYLGSVATYEASAQASFDNGVIVSLDDGRVEKTGQQGAFGAIFDGGTSLGALLLTPTKSTIEFGAVDAVSDEAEGHGIGTFSGEGANLDLSASVNGKAIDTGDFAFGNGKVRWSFRIDFQNLSTEDMTAIWTVNHVLDAEAQADPRGTAFAVSRFSGTGADDVVNAAADPVIERDDGPDLVSDPPSLSGTTRFNFALAPGERKTFRFALQAQGNATIVPLPASGMLFAAGALLAAGYARRTARRRPTA